MLPALFDALAWLGEFSSPLAWVVVASFLVGALVERRDRRRARYVVAFAWVLFGLYFLSVVHHFTFVQKSIIESVGTAVAVPACLSVAALLLRGRDSLFVLSRSIAVMGLFFLPFTAIGVLRQTLIEVVTDQTAFLISVVGFEPTVVDGFTVDGLRIAEKTHPYENTFVFYPDGEPITYNIKIACTGIGSMAILGGLITAVNAPLSNKIRALSVSIPVIYVLNLVRNVFIALGFGTQSFQVFPDVVGTLFAVESEVMVSYYVADRVIAQSASVVALVGITWLVVRQVPEVLGIVEDALYVVTRRELDLRSALGIHEVRADGEGESAPERG